MGITIKDNDIICLANSVVWWFVKPFTYAHIQSMGHCNIFTGVYYSVHMGEGASRMYPPVAAWMHPPTQKTDGQPAAGMHPTGMHPYSMNSSTKRLSMILWRHMNIILIQAWYTQNMILYCCRMKQLHYTCNLVENRHNYVFKRKALVNGKETKKSLRV